MSEARKIVSKVVSLPMPVNPLLRTRRGGKEYVRDPVRKTFVRLTPEERVRQQALSFLIHRISVPSGLIAVEKGFAYNGMNRRADIIVFDRRTRPLILVECKSPGVHIGQQAFDQVCRYNTQIRAPYVIVTNGTAHYCLEVDFDNESYRFVAELPGYDDLVQTVD